MDLPRYDPHAARFTSQAAELGYVLQRLTPWNSAIAESAANLVLPEGLILKEFGCNAVWLVAGVGDTVQKRALATSHWGDDPIDQMCRNELDPLVGHYNPIWLYPGQKSPVNLLFWMRITGLPVQGPIMPAPHPRFGSWWAIRALVGLTLPFPLYSGEPALSTPCPDCPAPCSTACPAKAVHKSGWRPSACLSYRLEDGSECADNCPARCACVVGKEFTYSEPVRQYHYQISFATLRSWQNQRSRS